MVNTQHSQNDAVKVAARSSHSAAQISQWLPSHPSKSRSPYSALEPLWWSPLTFLNLNSPFFPTDHVPVILASLFFPHHAKYTRDEDRDICTDHWGFICLYPVGIFSPLWGWSSAKYYCYIYATYSDTPKHYYYCIFSTFFLQH